jgi:hypothetical protein
MIAEDLEFLRYLGLREDVITQVDQLILDRLKRSERFKDAFAHLHEVFRNRDNLAVGELGVLGEGEEVVKLAARGGPSNCPIN